MVNYSKSEEEFAMYAIELTKILCKPFIITGLITLPLCVYFLIIGYVVVDSEMLISGYSLLVILALSIMNIVVMAIKVKSQLFKSFKASMKNGVCECTISVVDDIYIINNISIGQESKISKQDIKKIKTTKKIIMVKTQTDLLYLFPNKAEIREMFENPVNGKIDR